MAYETPKLLSRIFANPLAVRELRVACRSWKLVAVLSAYLLIQAAIFAIWVYKAYENGIYDDPTSTGSNLFLTMSIVLMCVVMLVFPAFSATAIASEHERQSFDLLLLTPLRPWEIAQGKFFASAIQASVFLIATVPLFALVNLFGGIHPAVFFATMWVLILLSVLISFIGVFASSLVKKSVSAVIVTYLFAMVFGFLLLVIFLYLYFAPGGWPLTSFFRDPTISEGIFAIGALTVTCAIYCSLLFLSTSNRLKPTSHNKSTSLRICWMVVAIVIPLEIGLYYLSSRIETSDVAINALMLGLIYLTLMMLVPALSFPAEPPLPSRRVRREMDRMPKSFMGAGGSLLFPGSARGVAYFSILCTLSFALAIGAVYVGFDSVTDRLDDSTVLREDYRRASQLAGRPARAASAKPAYASAAEMREAVEEFYESERLGVICMVLALLLSLLTLAQITWRISLSGLSKTLSGVLALLVLVAWLAVPLIVETFTVGSSKGAGQSTAAQFSPVAGGYLAYEYGRYRGASQMAAEPEMRAALEEYADSLKWRWITFLIAAGGLGAVLLASNLYSYRKILRRAAEGHTTAVGAKAAVGAEDGPVDRP